MVSRWLVLAALVGCAGAGDDDVEEGSVVDGKADGASTFALKLTRNTAGLVRAKESPKLAGAPSTSKTFACDEERTEAGWRLLCERNAERLAVTFGSEELAGAAIYHKSSSSPDARSYFHCSATTAAPDEWPAELTCTSKQPKGMIGGQMVSPFASSIDDAGIFNSHLVSEDATSGAKIYRGMKPFRDADFTDLQDLGVGGVLIFKKPTASNEVTKETDALAQVGIASDHVVNEQFGYKDFTSFDEPCRMTVRSLAQLRGWASSGTNVFFHCTVGEDRTGYLAGLYRLLTESSASVDSIFTDELCEHGYSAGNPQKPFAGVVREIDADLTPLFLKMAFKIKTGQLTPAQLDESVCADDPETDPAFTGTAWDAGAFRCSISTRYRL